MRNIKEETGKTVKELAAIAGKYKYVLLMVAVGVIFMVLPSFGGGVKDTVAEEATGESTYSLEETQSQLEQMLSEIEGVGRVNVMLTVSSGSRIVYQDDREVSCTGSVHAPEDYTSRTETVLINQGGSGQEALQSQEIYPPYIGALVVCDGADQPGIVLKVKEAVSVLTGLGTDCISVVKRSES